MIRRHDDALCRYFVFDIISPIGGADLYVFPKHPLGDYGGLEGWEEAGYTGTGLVDMVDHKAGQWARHERFDDYCADEDLHFKFREMEVLLAAGGEPRLALVASGRADIAPATTWRATRCPEAYPQSWGTWRRCGG